MVRVLIVEDQMIMQKYFEYLILQEPEFRLVETVADAREAVKICGYSAIDLVLMDVQTFHNHDGLTAGKAIKEEHPATKSGHYYFIDRSQNTGTGKNGLCRQFVV